LGLRKLCGTPVELPWNFESAKSGSNDLLFNHLQGIRERWNLFCARKTFYVFFEAMVRETRKCCVLLPYSHYSIRFYVLITSSTCLIPLFALHCPILLTAQGPSSNGSAPFSNFLRSFQLSPPFLSAISSAPFTYLLYSLWLSSLFLMAISSIPYGYFLCSFPALIYVWI
jgi:hypothetical protein